MTIQKDINRRANQFKQKGINEKHPTIKNIQTSSPIPSRGVEIRRAKLTANAGATATITANLYNAKTGILDEETEITVYCNISGGTALNEAIPVLVIGQEIVVEKLPYLNGGTLEQRWYCQGIFQTMPPNCT